MTSLQHPSPSVAGHPQPADVGRMPPFEPAAAPPARGDETGAAPRLLALDTSTERLVLALTIGPASFSFEDEGGARASSQLIPQLLALMARHQVALADLDAIAFGRGPGAFTGLRTSVSVAQGLAFGTGKPVLAIDSLMIVADDARAQWLENDNAASVSADAFLLDGIPTPAADAAFDIWVTMDARMDQVYAAAYHWPATTKGGQTPAWQVGREPALYDLDTLHALWAAAPPLHVAGSALDAFAERLPVGTARAFPTQRDRPGALARLSRAAWAAGAVLPAEQALPLYLRDKVAQTTAERAALRDARHDSQRSAVAPPVAF